MGKLVKVVVVLALIGVVVYYAMNSMSDGSLTTDANLKDGVRVEEKYGVTTEGVSGS